MNISSLQGSLSTMGVSSQSQSLTESQKANVASILEDFDADNMTEESALEIMDAIKEAGYSPGPGLAQAIAEAGFDPREIGSFATQKQGPPPPPKNDSVSSLDTETFGQLVEILKQYDLANITQEEEQALVEQLQSNDLLFPGMLLNEKI